MAPILISHWLNTTSPPPPLTLALNLLRNIFSSHFTTSIAPFLLLQTERKHPPLVYRRQENRVQTEHQKHHHNLISILNTCTNNTHLLQIHAHLVRTSLIHDSDVSRHFLSRVSISQSGDLSYPHRVLYQIEYACVSHYNVMIKAYSKSNSPEKGFYLYREMGQNGFSANPFSSSLVVKCCVKMCCLEGGLQVHGKVLRDGHQSDSLLLTALMDLYSLCKKSEDACKLFDEIPLKDTVAWNVLISCYIRNQRTRDVLGLFDSMKSDSSASKPDNVTCLLVLQACANLGALEFGKQVHGYIDEHGYSHSLSLCNSLIAMYSRCGCLDEAYAVFEGIQEKNVVSWSAMVSGFAMNGYAREAIDAFREMVKIGVLPDDQTFTGVLSACSHSGLVNEGEQFFYQMTNDFGIKPNIHHYGCMVDLLGRAGLLVQAYELIMSMEINPDSTVWRTLLSACRLRGNYTLGERIIEHLIELKAQEAGDYVLLLNIYSSVGNWEKVTELRKFMKKNAIQTTPGCSTIELKGVVHDFVVDEISHSRIKEVYKMLEEINQQLKIAGYVWEITSELHNLSTEEKGCALSYHSEKLAIAFGILATPPGSTIRVAKNLRTCVDCHNFAKVLSSVYNREVIIRDRTRFHHFRGGHCSCNDYW